jgi:hypothetical protein
MKELTAEEMLEVRGGKNQKDSLDLKKILHGLHIKTDGNVAVSVNVAEVAGAGATDVLQIAESAAGTVTV